MQDVNSEGEFYCVDGPIGIAGMGFHDFQNAGAAEPLQWLGVIALFPELSIVECDAKCFLYWLRQRANILAC